jgi:hypothetical protein
MNTLQISNLNSEQWILSMIIILGIILALYCILKMDFKKDINATGAPKPKDIDISSKELQKATEEALFKATEQMTSAYRLSFEKQLKENMVQLNNLFKINSDKITNEFSQSLSNFHNQTQEMITSSQNKIDGYSKDLESEMNESILTRKKEAIEAVDNKINKILMAYLNNSLEGSIDLSDQQDYILEKLEKNKITISKDINNV